MDQRASQTISNGTWLELAGELPKGSVYRSREGRVQFHKYYDKVLDSLEHPLTTKLIHTSFGATNVVMMGDFTAPPVLVLTGVSTASPLVLDFFKDLAKTRLLIAPDLIGQPGRSADVHFSPKNNAYGKWMIELLDGLGIQKIDIAAASFGGSIALDLMKLAPHRVGKQALIVPAGLTPRMPYLKIYAKLLLSWLTYRYLPSNWLLHKVGLPLSRHLTEENLKYLDIIIRQTAFWRHYPAGPFFPKDMPSDMEEALVVFSYGDMLFPYEQTSKNAEASLNIGKRFELSDSAHMPNPKEMAPIHDEIEAYFKS